MLISLDQFANTLWGGDPDETISSRLGKHYLAGDSIIACIICKLLNYLEKDHCIKSIEPDRGRKIEL